MTEEFTRTYELGRSMGFCLGQISEQQRIIKIIEGRRDYDCRCKCNCHAEPAPCIFCQADNELIEIIKGETE